jgi:hypothetical protein
MPDAGQPCGSNTWTSPRVCRIRMVAVRLSFVVEVVISGPDQSRIAEIRIR